MSNNSTNYNAMSNKPKETTYEPKEEKLVTEGNVVNDTPSYNVSESTTVKMTGDPECTKTVVVPEPEPPEAPVYGVVSNCEKLNVRRRPAKKSEVVTVIKAGTEVAIVSSKSTEDWYYIALWEGYVMKEFITIK
jgi:hypothetical protein